MVRLEDEMSNYYSDLVIIIVLPARTRTVDPPRHGRHLAEHPGPGEEDGRGLR